MPTNIAYELISCVHTCTCISMTIPHQHAVIYNAWVAFLLLCVCDRWSFMWATHVLVIIKKYCCCIWSTFIIFNYCMLYTCMFNWFWLMHIAIAMSHRWWFSIMKQHWKCISRQENVQDTTSNEPRKQNMPLKQEKCIPKRMRTHEMLKTSRNACQNTSFNWKTS